MTNGTSAPSADRIIIWRLLREGVGDWWGRARACDLLGAGQVGAGDGGGVRAGERGDRWKRQRQWETRPVRACGCGRSGGDGCGGGGGAAGTDGGGTGVAALAGAGGRSEERRVGKEGRSRWSPHH